MFMEKMGNIANSMFAKILLALIAVAFVLSGVGGYMFYNTNSYAIKINGEKISQQYFSNVYQAESNRIREALGAQFANLSANPEFAQSLSNDVLNRIINETLLRQYAQNLNLVVSKSRVEKAIVLTPEFQQNGKFNNDLYLRTLRANNLTPEQYASLMAEGLRDNLLKVGFLGSTLSISSLNDALAKAYLQTRQVKLAEVSPDNFASQVKITPAEVQNYYNTNQNAFNLPEQVKVQYIDLTQNDVKKNIKISSVEVAQYYQENKDQYVQRHLAHIQVPTLAEAEKIYQALKQGGDFAKLAKEKSQDVLTAKNGGDLSWSLAGSMPKTFEVAANKLKVGEYSQPVKVDDSYHIIKLLGEKVQSLSQAQEDIEAKLRNEMATKEFYATEKLLNEKAFENPESLEAVAKASGLELHTTELFSQQDIPTQLNYSNVITAIFNSDISKGGANSDALSVGNQHSIIVRVIEHKDPRQQSLEDVKGEIEKTLIQQKAKELAFKQAQAWAMDLNTGRTVNSLKFGEEQTVSYAETDNPDLTQQIMALPKPTAGKTAYYAIKTPAGEIKLVQLNKIGERTINAQQREIFDQQMLQVRQAMYQELLVKYLRDKASIEVNPELIKQATNN